jgi:hypothetical protein
MLQPIWTNSMKHSNSWEASQEIPNLLWNSKVHYRVHKIPPLVPILSHMNPVLTFFKICLTASSLCTFPFQVISSLQDPN